MHHVSEYLTIKDVCELLKVKESWLRRQIFYKQIPYHKLGRLIRFKRDEIISWIKGN